MATRSKEEDLLLDQKIAQIRKKNEEILKRAKEVEEDKKLAMEQNALVQLRPANVDDSRERTPALRPSSREFIKESSEIGDLHETNPRHPEMPSFRGRGGRGGYNRDRNDRKDGPPPDPRSFLADSERDPPTPRDGRGKPFTRGEETQKGNREFQKGGKGGENFRRGGERGRGGGRGDRMYHRETREDAWRAERLRIDEARIQRQKTADGKWRREWDNDKIHEEVRDDAKVGRGRGDAQPMEQRKHSTHASSSPHTNFDYSHGRGGSFRGGRGRGGNSYYSDRGSMADGSFGYDMQRSHNNTPGINDIENFRGRGSGRSAPHIKNSTPALRRTIPNSPISSRNDKLNQDVDETEIVVDSSKGAQHRSVKNVGDSLEVSISNVQDEEHNEEHNDRFAKDQRHKGRFSRQGKNSRSSYSSQSEDEVPKDKGYSKTKRDREHFQNKQSAMASSHMTNDTASKNIEQNIQRGEVKGNSGQTSENDIESSEQLTNIKEFGINIPKNQNPLPPFKAMSEVTKIIEAADNGEPTEQTEGDNSKSASDVESSYISNGVQNLESNSEQGATETNIVIPVEEKPSSVESNNIRLEGIDHKETGTKNNATVKDTLKCDQSSPLSADSCNKSIDIEQTNTTMEVFAVNTNMSCNKDNSEIDTMKVNVENEQEDVIRLQENEVKTENSVATEKIVKEVIYETNSDEKVSSEIKSDPKLSCDVSNAEKTLVCQLNTENKELLSENEQNVMNITETVTANEVVKSAE